jgi:hypothetical protein
LQSSETTAVVKNLVSRKGDGGSEYDDAVVALGGLDVELVLQKEPGRGDRAAEAAEHLEISQ